jgi:hypothetical protein
MPSPIERGDRDIDSIGVSPGETPSVVGVPSPEDAGVNSVNEGGQKPDSSHVNGSVVVEV